MKSLRAIAAAGLVIGLGACRPAGSDNASSGSLSVFVSIPPQAYFVERVAGERVRVEVLLPPGRSPETFAPTPRQLGRLARSRAYFTIGVPFESELRKRVAASFPDVQVIETNRDLPGAERPADADPHTWLDPKLARMQVEAIGEALCRLDPPHAAEYERNAGVFRRELDRLDARITAGFEPLAAREFYVFHPAYGCFAAAYGLKQSAVQVEGKAPSARKLVRLIERARAAGVRTLFVQPQFESRSVDAVAEAIGAAVVPLDPLARDYVGNLDQMAARIKRALSAAGK
jgi:zinc transport system substrate-binding protein